MNDHKEGMVMLREDTAGDRWRIARLMRMISQVKIAPLAFVVLCVWVCLFVWSCSCSCSCVRSVVRFVCLFVCMFALSVLSFCFVALFCLCSRSLCVRCLFRVRVLVLFGPLRVFQRELLIR